MAVFLGVFITHMITRPVKQVFKMLETMAQGDLTHEIHAESKDEIGDMVNLLNTTKEGIKDLVAGIKERTNALSDVGNELSSMTVESVAALEHIAGSSKSIQSRAKEQLDSTVKANTEVGGITEQIDKLSGSIELQASHIQRSSSAIEELAANIAAVTHTLGRNEQDMRNLAESSEKGRSGLFEVSQDLQDVARESEGLLEINAVMQNIASQTNLLSMNAAIEAAHAGEAGKGFAVVADEIRKLAESSSEQAAMVSAVLKKIKESLDKISGATQLVLSTFERIDTGVKTVSSQTDEIKNAMEEQEIGNREILSVVETLNTVTENVTDSSSRMRGNSTEIVSASRHLMALTNEVNNGVIEMTSSIEQISIATTRVQEIGLVNKHNIEGLMAEIEKFKV
jgi:methyl-accepting chemotaxis protein